MRADKRLVEVGLARSRGQAAELIELGLVYRSELPFEDGVKSELKRAKVQKPSEEIGDSEHLFVEEHSLKHKVSRAALKLEAALAHLNGTRPESPQVDHPRKDFVFTLNDKTVLDIGQSTGGFTQVALEWGAKRVVGIEVGSGQLHPELRSDERVVALEKTHFLEISRATLAAAGASEVDLALVDVSFISVFLIAQKMKELFDRLPMGLLLVKPQFEIGSANLTKAGVPKRTVKMAEVVLDWKSRFEGLGYQVSEIFPSAQRGSGGVEEWWFVVQF